VPRHVTLAGQLLALQLLIVLGVLAGVTAVSIAQSGETTRRAESRRALNSAENVAGNPLVRERLPVADPQNENALPATAEASRALSGARSAGTCLFDRRQTPHVTRNFSQERIVVASEWIVSVVRPPAPTAVR